MTPPLLLLRKCHRSGSFRLVKPMLCCTNELAGIIGDQFLSIKDSVSFPACLYFPRSVVHKDVKRWGARNTICGHKAKDNALCGMLRLTRYAERSQRCINWRTLELFGRCLDGAYETLILWNGRQRKSDCQLFPVHESPFEKMPHTPISLILFSRWKNPWQVAPIANGGLTRRKLAELVA